MRKYKEMTANTGGLYSLSMSLSRFARGFDGNKFERVEGKGSTYLRLYSLSASFTSLA